MKKLKEYSVTKCINRAKIDSAISYANNRILVRALAMLRSGAEEQRIRSSLKKKAELYR